MTTGVELAAPRRQDYLDVHELLLAAAAELFAERGPDAVTVSGVAERAGVSRATAHRHVGTRDALLWEVTGRLLAEMGADLDQPLLPDSLAATVDSLLDSVIGDPARARRALTELATGRTTSGRPETGTGTTMLEHEIAMMGILAASPMGRPGIDTEVLGVINLAGMLLWSALVDRGLVEGGVDRYRAEVVRLLLHGAIDPAAAPSLTAPTLHPRPEETTS